MPEGEVILSWGRLLDRDEIERLSGTTRLPIEFFPFDASGSAPYLYAGTPSMGESLERCRTSRHDRLLSCAPKSCPSDVVE